MRNRTPTENPDPPNLQVFRPISYNVTDKLRTAEPPPHTQKKTNNTKHSQQNQNPNHLCIFLCCSSLEERGPYWDLILRWTAIPKCNF